MKKVIGILALLVFAGNIASAELLKNFKYDGKVEVNAYTSNNNNDNNGDTDDKTSDVDTRVQINMGFDLAEDVDAVVSVVKNDRQYNGTSQDVNTITTKLFVEQAYLNLKGVLGFDHKVGRQYYGNEGDLVVYAGPQGWPYPTNYGVGTAMNVTAVDAYTGWYTNGKLALHGIAGKTANNNAYPNVDTDVTGIVGKYNLMELLNVGAYVYEKKDYVAAGGKDITLDVVGVKADGKVEGLNLGYYGEMAKNYGRQAAGVNYTGSALLLGANMDLNVMGKWTFSGEMAMGSGDKDAADKNKAFQAIASDYRPGLIWGGLNGMSGLANTGVNNTGLTTWNLGAKWNPEFAEKLTLCGKLINLTPTEEKVNGTATGYDKIGNELDITAKWQHNENVALGAYLAYFSIDKDYSAVMGGTDDEATTLLGLTLNVKF
jgi:hypothetical protein